MRPSLSRLTALIVIGLAFVAAPGTVVSRAGRSDSTVRMIRGGFHRLGSSDAAALHVADDHDPDSTPAGDLVGSIAQLGHAPTGSPVAPPGVLLSVPRAIGTFVLLDVPPVASFFPAAVRTRPSGRAPPVL